MEEALSLWWRGRRPDAQDDKAETNEDTPVGIDLLANDKDAVSIFKISDEYVQPGETVVLSSGAKVTLESSGKITYDPSSSVRFDLLNDGEKAQDSFSYSVFGMKGFDTAMVQIGVSGVTDDPGGNQPPVANNDVVVIPFVPFPSPYPDPVPPLAEVDTSQPAVTAEIEATSVEGPILTTLAIGEEGDPDPLPDSIDISPLTNDFDPDGGPQPLTIGTIDGEFVKSGDVVTLRSGAEVAVNDDGTLTYSGGLLDDQSSALVATDDVMALIETASGDASLESIVFPEPLPLPAPILADLFTYQAFDGESYSKEASIAVVRACQFDVLATEDASIA